MFTSFTFYMQAMEMVRYTHKDYFQGANCRRFTGNGEFVAHFALNFEDDSTQDIQGV
jgi:hypothetical protein